MLRIVGGRATLQDELSSLLADSYCAAVEIIKDDLHKSLSPLVWFAGAAEKVRTSPAILSHLQRETALQAAAKTNISSNSTAASTPCATKSRKVVGQKHRGVHIVRLRFGGHETSINEQSPAADGPSHTRSIDAGVMSSAAGAVALSSETKSYVRLCGLVNALRQDPSARKGGIPEGIGALSPNSYGR